MATIRMVGIRMGLTEEAMIKIGLTEMGTTITVSIEAVTIEVDLTKVDTT